MRSEYKLIFERSHEGRRAYDLPKCDAPDATDRIPESMRAAEPLRLPELGEVTSSVISPTFPAAISALTTASTPSAPAR